MVCPVVLVLSVCLVYCGGRGGGGRWGMGVCDGVKSEDVEGGGEGVSVLLARRGGGEGGESGRREGSAGVRGGRWEGDGVHGGMKEEEEEEEDECPQHFLEKLSVWKRAGLLGGRVGETEEGGETLIPSTPAPALSRRKARLERVQRSRAVTGRAEVELGHCLVSVHPVCAALHRD